MIYRLLIILFAIAPFTTFSQPHSIEESTHNQIQADELKSWYDQNKSMVVIDARSRPYFDGILLPHAIWLPFESSEKEIEAAIPSKESLIVVYCFGVDCPASGWLYDKLVAMGYTHLYEYHEGIEDWMERGFPIYHISDETVTP